MNRGLWVLAVLGCACGPPSPAEEDAGRDAGRDAGMRVVDAGVVDAGVREVDAGPPPIPTATGSMTVNGMPMTIAGGFATLSGTSLQLRLNTAETAQPLVQMIIVIPADTAVGVSQACGGSVLFSSRWIVDSKIAFFTLGQTCEVKLTQLAAEIGEDFSGTFSGSARYEPRSALDAGFQVMDVTNASFTVRRY